MCAKRLDCPDFKPKRIIGKTFLEEHASGDMANIRLKKRLFIIEEKGMKEGCLVRYSKRKGAPCIRIVEIRDGFLKLEGVIAKADPGDYEIFVEE
ncbi:MAG: hypothetical protein ACD_15C00195G0016 [uncultured bacterium]|nr:MAG: hypothetical protein ACD_15C00195G0016 [uncultured bacterium]HCU71042.1 hypothetical protein [Candidatus Moranbacteria bacterium]